MKKYFYRYILEKINKRFKDNQIIIIIGTRQAGKTMVIKNYFANFLKKREKSFYFNFEKSTDLEIFQSIDHLEKYLLQNNLSIKKDILFIAIDEFQYLKNATKFLKLIYDEYPNIKILATGSSAIEIQKHLKESLVGRKKVYYIYTLSFEEYLLAINQEKLWKVLNYNNFLPQQIEQFNFKFLNNYLLWGGYPRLADRYKNEIEEKKEELADIYNSYVQKDIKALIGGENILSFNNLVKILASQIGNLLNISELSNVTNLSRYDIEKYLNILEQTFIIKRIPAYFINKRKEISKMPKIYFTDLGLANMITSNFSTINNRPNLGAIIENYVLNQICYFISVSDTIYFWRTLEGAEVDFVWKKDNLLIPIEVKWKNFDKPNIPSNLLSFIKKYKNIKQAWIVNKNFYEEKKIGDVNFIFIPASLLIKKIKQV